MDLIVRQWLEHFPRGEFLWYVLQLSIHPCLTWSWVKGQFQQIGIRSEICRFDVYMVYTLRYNQKQKTRILLFRAVHDIVHNIFCMMRIEWLHKLADCVNNWFVFQFVICYVSRSTIMDVHDMYIYAHLTCRLHQLRGGNHDFSRASHKFTIYFTVEIDIAKHIE